jgi:hypothetical protein
LECESGENAFLDHHQFLEVCCDLSQSPSGHVILQGAHPPILSRSKEFQSLLNELWAPRMKHMALGNSMKFVETAENWTPGVEAETYSLCF